MNNELDETHENDIEIIEEDKAETTHECGNHELHETTAEFLTEQTNENQDFESGEIDPAQLAEAHHLSDELGDEGLQNWLHDEVSDDLQKSLDRLNA